MPCIVHAARQPASRRGDQAPGAPSPGGAYLALKLNFVKLLLAGL